MIARRLSEYCECVGILPEEQRGFPPNRYTTDMMFEIGRLQELARKKRIPLYVCSIDITKAYDFVDRTLFRRVLARFGVPQKKLSRSFVISMRVCEHACGSTTSVIRVVHCGTGPSLRVRDCVRPVKHLLRGGYKRGLHAFQSGQRHYGRFGASEEENGVGRAVGGQPVESQSWRRRFGAYFTLTMPESSRHRPSS